MAETDYVDRTLEELDFVWIDFAVGVFVASQRFADRLNTSAFHGSLVNFVYYFTEFFIILIRPYAHMKC